MKKDQKFTVIKAIPLGGGKEIPKGTAIYRTHGVYYMDGGLLPQSYQEDFDNLIEQESCTGWKYVSPVTESTAYQNDKEDL